MTISYPLSHPTAPGFSRSAFRMRNIVAEVTSPFTGQQQIQEQQGEWWEVDLSLPPMRRPAAAEWQAFFASLRGKRGTFLLGDPDATTPRGVATGTPLADSAGSPSVNLARSRQIHTKGWSAGITGILKKFDYFQLGTDEDARLHACLTDVNSDGSGNAVIECWPALYTDIADNAPLVVHSAKGCFRLVQNDIGWDSGAAKIYGFAFGARSI
jgi:hypothetical protein